MTAFSRPPKTKAESQPEKDPDAMDEDHPGNATHGSDDTAAQEGTQDGGDQDVGDAFELAQLLFVVGHVAIKHIVYLELVEREWKRQKDEKQAGASMARPHSRLVTNNLIVQRRNKLHVPAAHMGSQRTARSSIKWQEMRRMRLANR